jgi:tRNA pseudouridine38-40 synthase
VTTRVALGISYDGSGFHGWQYQNRGTPTVQQAVELALSNIADHPVQVICAGRTDSGVHATGQVVHFDTTADRPDKAWVFGANAHLPDTISVNWCRNVDDSFHARFVATARRYLYVIYNSNIRSGLFANNVSRERRALDAESMHRAAQHLLGENDFSSFRAASCQSKTAMRDVHHIRVLRTDDLVTIDVQANAFLQHMVRNIAGVLMDIGARAQPETWSRELLALRDRTLGGVTADPAGLYMIDVLYDTSYGLPAGPHLPHFLSVLGERGAS